MGMRPSYTRPERPAPGSMAALVGEVDRRRREACLSSTAVADPLEPAVAPADDTTEENQPGRLELRRDPETGAIGYWLHTRRVRCRDQLELLVAGGRVSVRFEWKGELDAQPLAVVDLEHQADNDKIVPVMAFPRPAAALFCWP